MHYEKPSNVTCYRFLDLLTCLCVLFIIGKPQFMWLQSHASSRMLDEFKKTIRQNITRITKNPFNSNTRLVPDVIFRITRNKCRYSEFIATYKVEIKCNINLKLKSLETIKLYFYTSYIWKLNYFFMLLFFNVFWLKLLNKF